VGGHEAGFSLKCEICNKIVGLSSILYLYFCRDFLKSGANTDRNVQVRMLYLEPGKFLPEFIFNRCLQTKVSGDIPLFLLSALPKTNHNINENPVTLQTRIILIHPKEFYSDLP